ncbi:DNA phosphorothioation-associated DGQHR protein 1 [Bordetella trematum]|nr:DNA phosphorothioation-associated DGQHR protein 1 [Bordetella trematum]
MNFPVRVSALKVEQPLGLYYVAVLPAELLLKVSYSHALSASLDSEKAGYHVEGTQRLKKPKRMPQIADYINRPDSAFPGTIILAANFQKDDGLILGSDDNNNQSHKEWMIEADTNGNFTLIIPTDEKLAAVIDGQHRLFAFADAKPERLEMDLICSIFLDLPKPFQAQLFATINSTQEKVDKSLTYELFGYNLNEEEEEYWSPDKLAVFLTRKLSTDPESPLSGRIVIAPRRDKALDDISSQRDWKISTAVVVEGIMRLFSSNPKKDINNLLDTKQRRRLDIDQMRTDRSPLRQAYINSEDIVIYKMTINFLIACENLFWKNAPSDSFITRTTGVQALFDILRILSSNAYTEKKISVSYFEQILAPAAVIDFSEEEYKNASGSGRGIIRRAIESKIF